MEVFDYEPKPKRPPVWPWVFFVFYAMGLGACWLFGKRNVVPAMECFTGALIIPLAIIWGIRFGTQDKDFWT